jgi:hypothetical protein
MVQACVSIHSVMIHDRGGKNRLSEITNVGRVKWSRERDAISGATVTVYGRACEDQATILNKVRSRRHELVLYRGNDRVWEGPIVEVAWYADRVEIVARDVVSYLDGTPLSKAWPGPDRGGQYYMTDRIEDILDYELVTPYTMDVGIASPDVVTVPRWESSTPPANVLPFLDVRTGTVLTRSDTLPFQMTVGEHLRNLARGGLDYTTIGRQILIWDSADSIGQTRTLTEADFYGEVAVFESGTEFAAVAHVSAEGQEEDENAVGSAGKSDTYYGPWTIIATLDDEEGADTPDQAALNTQARRQLVGKNPVPLEIRLDSANLRLSHDLTIQDLVAGVQIPVLANMNLRKVSQMQRLNALHVEETPAGETIGVNLIPAGEVVAVP